VLGVKSARFSEIVNCIN